MASDDLPSHSHTACIRICMFISYLDFTHDPGWIFMISLLAPHSLSWFCMFINYHDFFMFINCHDFTHDPGWIFMISLLAPHKLSWLHSWPLVNFHDSPLSAAGKYQYSKFGPLPAERSTWYPTSKGEKNKTKQYTVWSIWTNYPTYHYCKWGWRDPQSFGYPLIFFFFF